MTIMMGWPLLYAYPDWGHWEQIEVNYKRQPL